MIRTGVCLLALAFVSASARADGPAIRVAAASDLALAFAEVGKLFEKQTGEKVAFTFGSTGLLAKQITERAPFDIFAGANISFVDGVVKAGACLADTKAMYARGRIVAVTAPEIPLPRTLAELADPRYKKIAIANPEHAPYGQAAREALTKVGLWDSVKGRVVFGENVQQTLQFARSGNAELAIVALSLSIASPRPSLAIDPALHGPIDQALVVCGTDAKRQATARRFVALVSSPEGRTIMRRFGFLLPGETLASSK